MDKQIKYLLGVLILLLISAYFLSVFGGLSQYFKDDITAFLEARIPGEVSFSSVSFWPLNRIKLKEFSYSDKNKNQISIEELNLDYKLNVFDFDKIIELKFIEAKEAEIKIEKEIFSSKNQPPKETASNLEPAPFLSSNQFDLSQLDLPKFMEGIRINILNSKLELKNKNYQLEFDSLNLGVQAEKNNFYQLDFSTALIINNFKYKDYQLSDLRADNLALKFQRQNKNAKLYLQTESLALNNFIKLLKKKKYNYQDFKINLNDLSGDFASRTEVEIKDNKIAAYNSEINFENLKLAAFYNSAGKKEKIDLAAADLELLLRGPELELHAQKQKLMLANNPINFSFNLDQEFNYQLNLKAENFKYNYNFLTPYLKKAEFSLALDLKAEEKKITEAQAALKTKNITNEYLNAADSNFLIKVLEDEIFIEKAVVNFADDSKIDLKGSYDLKEKKYLLSAESNNFKISDKLITLFKKSNFDSNYLEYLNKFKNERTNFLVDAAGRYSKKGGFSAAGNFDFDFDFKNKDNELKLKSEFWYVEQKLFINSFKLFSDFVYFDLLGEIDFAAEKINLRYAAKNFEPAVLNNNFDLNFNYFKNSNPTIKYIEGKIADDFNNPTLTADLKMDQFAYQNYLFDEINIKALYQNENLKLTEAEAVVNQGLLRLRGEVSDLLNKAELNLKFESENLYFQDLAAASNTELPLSGEVDLEAEITGPVSDYKLDFRLNTFDTVLNYQGQEYDLSNLKAYFKKENEKIKIVDFSLQQKNLDFKAAGFYDLNSGFDLDYYFKNIEPGNYLSSYFKTASQISGSLNLEGHVEGKIEALNSNFQLNSENLIYNGIPLKVKENTFNFNFKKQILNINNLDFNLGSGSYSLEGKFFDFKKELKSDLSLEFVKVPLQNLSQKYLKFYPFSQDLILRGKNKIKSKGSDYNLFLDLGAVLAQSREQVFSLNGNIGREMDLNIKAANLPLNFSTSEAGFKIDAEAVINCTGSLSGSLETPILNLKHTLSSIKINNTALDSIEGNILIEDQRRFSASETINFVEGGKVNFDSSYFPAEKELSLSSELDSLPLAFILSFFGENLKGEGEVNGSFRADGSLDSPQLQGEINFAGNSLELGIWAPIKNYQGRIKLKNTQAVIEKMKADFVDGSFEIGGKFNLLERNNFWDLNLNGKNLYFDYGSLTGDFDSQLSFTGPLLDPLLKGELKVYDFIIAIPFEWPAGGGGKKQNSAAFIPRIDLNILPDNNVRVKNSNMSILVEEGDLDLNYNHRRENSLMMEGRLRSSEGRFNYYNSHFSLNNAEAVFNPVDEGDIPNLQVNATTYAGGREININVNGPADKMTISFSSTPEMTEEEILNLLSTQGALGSAVIGGEDIGIQQIVMQELIRIVNGFLQEDLISDLESDFRTALSLDRIEIDALQYGLDREFNIYLGKNLTDRLYLEYASFFSEDEREDEISFQYKLTEITTLKGSYIGEDEYQITIENEIEF